MKVVLFLVAVLLFVGGSSAKAACDFTYMRNDAYIGQDYDKFVANCWQGYSWWMNISTGPITSTPLVKVLKQCTEACFRKQGITTLDMWLRRSDIQDRDAGHCQKGCFDACAERQPCPGGIGTGRLGVLFT